MALFHIIVILVSSILILPPSIAYVDLGFATLPIEPQYDPVPRPHQMPKDIYFRMDARPSMITAIAPSVTYAANGSYSTMYSLHYHGLFVRKRMGQGVFKRGVFANDPPIPTCTPCGVTSTATSPLSSTLNSSLSCTTHVYSGVFRSPAGTPTSTSYCYDSNYSGVFETSTTSSTGLPCCFTIPSSCLAHNSSSTTYTYTSGVFRSSSTMSYLSNFTTSSSTASPSSAISLSTPSSTVSSSFKTSSMIASSTTSSTTSSSTPVTSIGTAVPDTSSVSYVTDSLSSTTSVSSSSSDPLITTSVLSSTSGLPSASPSTSFSLTPTPWLQTSFALSSSTTTISNSASNGPRPGSSTVSTLMVITAIPPVSSPTPFTVVTTANNTVEGCGTASGSGIVVGTGTVYIGPGGLIPVVSSGTVSGYAATVVGCGTLTATTGSFKGSATIIACGYGSGTATMTGVGTVWPAIGRGLISFVSSGILTGSGSVRGCGTLTGSGEFSATGIYTTTITSTLSTSAARTTVEVYLSYCPTEAAAPALPRIWSNLTDLPDQITNSSLLAPNDPSDTIMNDMTFCHQCPKQAGICCPPGVACEGDGTCPWEAVIKAGYVLHGYNLVDIRNSSGPVLGKRHQSPEAQQDETGR